MKIRQVYKSYQPQKGNSQKKDTYLFGSHRITFIVTINFVRTVKHSHCTEWISQWWILVISQTTGSENAKNKNKFFKFLELLENTLIRKIILRDSSHICAKIHNFSEIRGKLTIYFVHFYATFLLGINKFLCILHH